MIAAFGYQLLLNFHEGTKFRIKLEKGRIRQVVFLLVRFHLLTVKLRLLGCLTLYLFGWLSKGSFKESLLFFSMLLTFSQLPDLGFNVLRSEFGLPTLLKVIIHGFLNSENTSWVGEMKDALLVLEDMNVVTVNWSNGAWTLYTQAVS